MANQPQTTPKYMVDVNTYRQMHPAESDQELATDEEMRLQGVDMSSDDFPSEPFCIMLPSTIRGYGFHDKRWSKYSSPFPS